MVEEDNSTKLAESGACNSARPYHTPSSGSLHCGAAYLLGAAALLSLLCRHVFSQ